MRKIKLASLCLSLATVLGLPLASHAETVTATLLTVNPFAGGDLFINGGVVTGGAVGELEWSGAGFGNAPQFSGDFTTFCIDTAEGADPNSTYTFTVQPDIALSPKVIAGGFMGPVKASEVEELFGAHYGSLTTTDALQAFQLALWNIIYDTDTSVSDGQGAFYVVGGSSDPSQDTNAIDANAIGLANAWLVEAADPQNSFLDDTHLEALIGIPGVQDQIVQGTPLPASLLGGGVLMAGLAMAGWKRRQAWAM